jgi:chromate transporter
MFVTRNKYFTENEVLETNAFCQMLPGASSTQLITLLAYKRGGYVTATLAFFIWILPATLIMTTLSFVLTDHATNSGVTDYFRFIQPMAIGFLLFTLYRSYRLIIKSLMDFIIMIIAAVLLYNFFKSPWIIPLIIITTGLISFIKTKKKENTTLMKPTYRWGFMIAFLFLFVTLATLSELSRKQEWKNRKAFNLVENNYRFGSLVFGGGDVLFPLMIDQYVARPSNEKLMKRNPGIIVLSKEQLLTGYGLVKAVPGPVFSISAFVASISLDKEKPLYRLIVILFSVLAIFLPGILLMFLFYPIFRGIKQHPVVASILQGINTSLIGVMLATIFYLSFDLLQSPAKQELLEYGSNLFILLTTFLLLNSNKVHPTFVVLLCLFMSKILG